MEFLAQLHPRIVHFPVALFILYFFFESTGILFKKEFLLKSAYIILVLGIIFSICAVLTGNQAQAVIDSSLRNDKTIIELIAGHQVYATVTLWYFFVLLVLRTYMIVKKKMNSKLKYILIVTGIIGVYLICMTGIRGGELVFNYGIGTHLFVK